MTSEILTSLDLTKVSYLYLRNASRSFFDSRALSHIIVADTLVEGGFVQAGELKDVSKLRYQAVFLMGAGGSGKGFVGQRWMKYMPGGGANVPPNVLKEKLQQSLSEQERGLTNLQFETVVDSLKSKGIKVEPVAEGSMAALPFKLYSYGPNGEQEIPPEEWAQRLPSQIYSQVEGLKEVVFSTPIYELPSYWRQVNPDVYKEELIGYLNTEPGYVHEMSSQMAKAYFEAILKTGDPLFVDGTGSNPKKMAEQINAAKSAGYKISLVYVSVPLVVNQIRNALRSRNVDPGIVTHQWKAIYNSFAQVRGLVDKSKVVINRNDQADERAYLTHKTKVDSFIAAKTGYPTLGAYIQEVAPNEYGDWAKVLEGGSNLTSPDRHRKTFDWQG